MVRCIWYSRKVKKLNVCQNDNQTPKKLLAKARMQSEKYPFVVSNFLKYAFLDACEKGLLI